MVPSEGSVREAGVNHCSLDIGKGEWLKFMDAFMKHWELIQEQVFWRNGRQEKEDLEDFTAELINLTGSWSEGGTFH